MESINDRIRRQVNRIRWQISMATSAPKSIRQPPRLSKSSYKLFEHLWDSLTIPPIFRRVDMIWMRSSIQTDQPNLNNDIFSGELNITPSMHFRSNSLLAASDILRDEV